MTSFYSEHVFTISTLTATTPSLSVR